jgi:hypothetical protein
MEVRMTKLPMVRAVVLWTALVGLSACAGGLSAPQLRIENRGEVDIVNLRVLFPEGEVFFGDVAAGETTAYRPVPNGVYGYAAYRFDVDGETVTQPVIDWVGELPMQGTAFTYVVEADSSQPAIFSIQLVEVVRDA